MHDRAQTHVLWRENDGALLSHPLRQRVAAAVAEAFAYGVNVVRQHAGTGGPAYQLAEMSTRTCHPTRTHY